MKPGQKRIGVIGWNSKWPILRKYKPGFLNKIAMPLGGIGTGSISLGGRGQLIHWEIRNRPAKGYVPMWNRVAPFFAIRAVPEGSAPSARVLEGPIPPDQYEGSAGCPVPLHGQPHFRRAEFAAAYPLAQVKLEDDSFPLAIRLEAFNPLIPCDPDRSGMPVAVLRYVCRNSGSVPVSVSVCGTLINPAGPEPDGRDTLKPDSSVPVQERRSADGVEGVQWSARGGNREAEQWGTLALAAPLEKGDTVSGRTRWPKTGWGDYWLDFWKDFQSDGRLDEPDASEPGNPVGSLAVMRTVSPGGESVFTFVIGWHYPNRMNWSREQAVGNYYTTRDADAWAAALRMIRERADLEADTRRFVRAFCRADLPEEVKEAALFNLSTLRSPTCFRTRDGHFFGWEGCCDSDGCCCGSCTHVWNYETALPFLFGSLSRSMREVSFLHSTDEKGLMSFRTQLPLAEKAREFGRAAADGQMGQLMRLYLDWRLGGDVEWLSKLWPAAKRAMAFCWIPGGWDADRDGVMEGCQHNTMDVEYYGPNPQMGFWYLGALLACAEMARVMGDAEFADTCQKLYERGRPWVMKHLFNGEYFEHQVRPPVDPETIAKGLSVGMGASDLADPKYQLGAGCLVDQLVGHVFARLCGLEYLVAPELVARSLKAILKYNRRVGFHDHFNPLRSFVLGDESALLMASYPRGNRPAVPFPYADEVMTGFEYTAACGMLQEGMIEEGVSCIAAIRDRYDGLKRNPFDEAECGHHYARAMMSWTAIPTLTGFQYDAADGRMRWGTARGFHFWSTGFAWGTIETRDSADGLTVTLKVLGGRVVVKSLEIAGGGTLSIGRELKDGATVKETIAKRKAR